ncbi:MAG: sigma-54-dependent Fis family transcriptional regulator, partial [Candidatus Rokubacteria bacterium]|nr:sigma-54-dependent Fis family transcriptional regulator [Candidatus Rokubacteria bacterium]
MTRALRVLVADDERNLRELMVRELARKGHEVDGVADGAAALERMRETAYDVAVLDMKMPKKEGIEVLRELQEFSEPPQVIVMTGFQEVSTAVEAMKLGAYDYLTKPTKIEELDIVIRKAAEKGQLVRDNVALRAHAPGAEPFGGILTRSAKMQEVLRIVERVAPTDSAVLILGESGTGKELVARAIHERSPRAARAFVPIHCGALPREVFESELFGHEKGAFTGAVGVKPGLVELADGGTLFLDEIGEMAPDSQVKLLRALETGTFFRVGGTRPRRVDVRLVAATNRDLADAMRQGEFRQDLYYRINTITVQLPPLRERREDIALLAQHFLEQKALYGTKRLSPAALAALVAFDWPGYVRELLHAVERAVILAKGEEIVP